MQFLLRIAKYKKWKPRITDTRGGSGNLWWMVPETRKCIRGWELRI